MTAAERARAVLATYDAQDPNTVATSGTHKDGSPVERYSLVDTAAEMAAILRELVSADPAGATPPSELARIERWRCMQKGCNPVLDQATAAEHNDATGHRVAKWPVRSADGQAKADERNRTGYYDRYNVGAKSRRPSFEHDDHPFSPEALGQE